jgi:hypothetical protein
MENNNQIIITDPKIIQFYTENKHINFQNINLLFIQLFQSIIYTDDTQNKISMHSQILSHIQNIQSNIVSINKNIYTISDSLIHSINTQFYELKSTYIQDINNSFKVDLNNSYDKLNSSIQLINNNFFDKIKNTIVENIPNQNKDISNIIHLSLDQFQKNISLETNNIINSNCPQNLISQFVQNFDSKTNTLLQPISLAIQASEDRIKKDFSSNNSIANNTKVFSDLDEFLSKYKNSSYKGQFGENQLEGVLNKLFPTSEIINNTAIKAACDFKIIRQKLSPILIETKNYDRNVTLDEVKKFIRDISEQKTHGIFLSQHSGITSKQNFQIDIIDNFILIYIHNTDYNPLVIKMATDIIDAMAPKLITIENNSSSLQIQKSTIETINKEYSSFIQKKISLIEILKDFNKKLLSEIEDIKLPYLSKFIIDNGGKLFNDENTLILCNICNKYKANNNKALAAHQRACKKK